MKCYEDKIACTEDKREFDNVEGFHAVTLDFRNQKTNIITVAKMKRACQNSTCIKSNNDGIYNPVKNNVIILKRLIVNRAGTPNTVSYTHLTLPTIYSV